eukprot:scaffold115874_cov25-Prasinocladus_malaysianus.AAC.1
MSQRPGRAHDTRSLGTTNIRVTMPPRTHTPSEASIVAQRGQSLENWAWRKAGSPSSSCGDSDCDESKR